MAEIYADEVTLGRAIEARRGLSMATHMRTSSSGEKTPEASSVDLNISTLRRRSGCTILRAHARLTTRQNLQLENRSSRWLQLVVALYCSVLYCSLRYKH